MAVKKVWMAVCAGLLALGCDDSSGPDIDLEVRVANQSSAAVTIRIGNTDYGSIAAGQTSPYKEVGKGVLQVRLNGVVVDEAEFCSGDCEFAGDQRWTAIVDDQGWQGYSIDAGPGSVSRSPHTAVRRR